MYNISKANPSHSSLRVIQLWRRIDLKDSNKVKQKQKKKKKHTFLVWGLRGDMCGYWNGMETGAFKYAFIQMHVLQTITDYNNFFPATLKIHICNQVDKKLCMDFLFVFSVIVNP
jgi:hypothetical protein